MERKPVVYIASPYMRGDVAVNTHFQCSIFDRLLGDRKVLPVAPLWSHFQHTLFPRSYEEWIAYDLEMLPLYDCYLRLTAIYDRMKYAQSESTGADAEVAAFQKMKKPVFHTIDNLYAWVATR